MDLQDVKNITIPEGSVKNIHDKDGRLLWGAVGYDTTYKGNTTQQTYSGKNLLALKDGTYTSSGITVVVSGGVVSVTENNNSGTNTYVTLALTEQVNITAGTYTLSKNDQSPYPYFQVKGTGSGNIIGTTYSNRTVTNTIANNDTIAITQLYFGSSKATSTFSPQLEAGSTPTSWEKFVGGIPSPNPGYPQNINVVTGTQIITLTDGEASANYTVELGPTELCKIGTYQDYIYKSGDDWYVHKAIDKSNLGDLAWFTAATNVSGVYRMTSSTLQGTIKPATSSSAVGDVICSHFTPVSANNTYACITGVAVSTAGSVQPYSPDYNYSSSSSDFKTWLTDNNVVLYYALVTPTDTKITDSSLISQLESIHDWLTRYGYNATVSGNLPIIIDKTNL